MVISNDLNYSTGAYAARERKYVKSKREKAADLINEGRRLAREALEEETREADLDREYGPRVRVPKP